MKHVSSRLVCLLKSAGIIWKQRLCRSSLYQVFWAWRNFRVIAANIPNSIVVTGRPQTPVFRGKAGIRLMCESSYLRCRQMFVFDDHDTIYGRETTIHASITKNFVLQAFFSAWCSQFKCFKSSDLGLRHFFFLFSFLIVFLKLPPLIAFSCLQKQKQRQRGATYMHWSFLWSEVLCRAGGRCEIWYWTFPCRAPEFAISLGLFMWVGLPSCAGEC